MAALMLRAARALTPREEITDAGVLIENGRITALDRRENMVAPKRVREVDARNLTVVPGFIDIHIHGAGARDVMEASAQALSIVAATVAQHGTTALVATTVTAPSESICGTAETVARFVRRTAKQPASTPQAQILGIHFEGPFINSKRRGVHPAELILQPTVATFERFLQAADGCALILTLAPELPGALEVIETARERGLTVALGHTDATYAEACAGIERGARHAVHVFNAMRPFSHRETGVLGAVLTIPEVTTEIIADGVHVHAAAIRLLLAAKTSERVVLASDATAATGMADGTYRLGTFEVTVKGGVCRNLEGRLAGSTLTLDRAIRHMVSLGVTLRDAVQMATLNPAARIGLVGKKGVLAPGADADLVLLTDRLEVAGVMTRGVGLGVMAHAVGGQ